MKQGSMSFLVPFLTFLLVTTSGEGAHSNVPTAGGTMTPKSWSTIIAYWQTMLPDSTMPSALLDLLTPPADYEDHISIRNKNSFEMPRKLGIHSVVEGKTKCQGLMGNNCNLDGLNTATIYGKGANVDKLNPALIYGKGDNGLGLNPALIYAKGANGGNLNPALIYGKGDEGVGLNPAMIYAEGANGVNLNPALIYGEGEKQPVHVTMSNMPADGHNHVDVGHDHSNLSNIAFLEDVLITGSKISPYIHPATPRAPLLLRDAAESIPMSTKSFTDILRMFSPVSLAMAENIWSVLDLCEHPNPAKGEKKACATSVESMVELAVSVLGTRELRAFSSPDVPVEGRAASKTYSIVAVRAITGTGDTMTCHGVTFPYKVFACHALNPTRVYSVTVEGDGVQEKMEALVVCHLDTSEFDPRKLPPHVKPGDGATICHFLNRDDILWAPAATTVGRQGAVVAAQ